MHDLRQPLATVAALVRAAEMTTALPPDVQHHLEQIKGELQLMADLCHRLLDEVPRGTAPVRLDQVAREAGVSASLAFGRPIEVHASATEVLGNELELRRAVQNLLDNACRAAGPEGVVRLVVREHSHRVRIEVHDDGPGFGGVESGNPSLGLNIVQLVATEHGGHIEVGESDLGGARLVIVLPTSEGVAVKTKPE